MQPLCQGIWDSPSLASGEPVGRELRCIVNAGADALLVFMSHSPGVALGPTECPVQVQAVLALGRWPPPLSAHLFPLRRHPVLSEG